MKFDKKEKKLFDKAGSCHICEQHLKNDEKFICSECDGVDFYKYKKSYVCKNCDVIFDKDDGIKVRDHCHYTGKFRGAAHNICNINYRKPKFFPVIFHNLSGYDAHLFITKLGGEIRCIASNEEKNILMKLMKHNYPRSKSFIHI